MIAFINDHRETYGVEPIRRVSPIAPSTCHDHEAKRRGPSRLPVRSRRDAALKVEVRRVFEENFRVYGARKVWRQLKREGFDVARRTVARLMRGMSLEGAIRGKPVKTTKSDKQTPARWIRSTASSGHRHRTGCGFRTSPVPRHGRASCTSLSSSMLLLAGLWGGGSAGQRTATGPMPA